MPFPLVTPRLFIRPFLETDLEPFLAYRSDPEVARYQGWQPMDRDAALAFLHDAAPSPWREGDWAQIGIARAAYFPSIKLTGMLGIQSLELNDFVSNPTRLWEIAPSVSVPLFSAGRIKGEIKTAEAEHNASLAAYRKAPSRPRLRFPLRQSLRIGAYALGTLEGADDLIGLALPHQPVVDEHGLQPCPQGPVPEQGHGG